MVKNLKIPLLLIFEYLKIPTTSNLINSFFNQKGDCIYNLWIKEKLYLSLNNIRRNGT